MEILVDLNTEQCSLAQPDDTSRFSVVVVGGTRADRVQELLNIREVGRLADEAGDHAWIAIRWIRRQAEGKVDGAWEGKFDAMVAYAKDHAFLDGPGNFLKAHIEYSQG